MRLYFALLAMCLAFASSCSRDKDALPEQPAPAITAVSRDVIQSGDTLDLTLTNFDATGALPEAFIGNRPSKIIDRLPGKVSLLVPDKVLSGKITLHLGDQTAEWPQIKVVGTPLIANASSLYVFVGDTLTLSGENLTGDKDALKIWMDDKPLTITELTNTTAKVVVPTGAAVRPVISWQSYGRSVYKNDNLKVVVRPINIVASNILDYLQKDPGMDITYEAMDYMSVTPVRKGLHDTLRQYLTGQVPCIMFLPNNAHMNARGIYKRSDVATRLLEFGTMLNGVVIKNNLTELALDKLYTCEYTHFVYAYSDGDPNLHAQIVLREIDGQKYVKSTTNTSPTQPIWETGNPVKIIRKHVCGNSIIYETESFVDMPYGGW